MVFHSEVYSLKTCTLSYIYFASKCLISSNGCHYVTPITTLILYFGAKIKSGLKKSLNTFSLAANIFKSILVYLMSGIIKLPFRD